jgi:MSHA biogenesis protein MshP
MRGFAIVSALFIIVALAALGAGMLHFASIQHATGAQDIQGTRALAAARAGSEWLVATIMAAESDGNPQFSCPPASPPTSFNGFTLAISCTHSTHDEEGRRIRVYAITSTATTAGSPGSLGYVERLISTVAATCRQTDNGLLC